MLGPSALLPSAALLQCFPPLQCFPLLWPAPALPYSNKSAFATLPHTASITLLQQNGFVPANTTKPVLQRIFFLPSEDTISLTPSFNIWTHEKDNSQNYMVSP